MKKDIIAGVVLLGIVAAFWVQRDFNGELQAAFPEFVLISLSLLAVAIIVRGVRTGDRTTGQREIDLRFLAVAIVLLLAWAAGMGAVGFTIAGVIAFVVMAQVIRRSRLSARRIAGDTAVALVTLIALFFVFTRVLAVPLPASVLIGM